MKTKYLYLVNLILILVSGCIKDDNSLDLPPLEQEVQVTLTINIPAPASTRSMSETDEGTLDKISVLLFRDNGTGQDETYLYTTHVTEFTSSGATTTAKVKLKKSTGNEAHRVVLLANLDNEVNALQDTWTSNMTKEQVLESITFDAYASAETDPANRVWDTDTPRYLPMWGESANTHVITSSLLGQTIGIISMMRSVATVDIILNPDAQTNPQPQGFDDFKLKDVKLYNVPQKGFSAPDPGNITNMRATQPTYSASFARSASTIVAYEAEAASQEDELGMTRKIYIPEAPNTNAQGVNMPAEEQTCLVVSGYYDEADTETWYRVDFINTLSPTENLRRDILRNHRYTFFVTAVEGPGYTTEEEAFDSNPMNLQVQVLVWDQHDMTDIEFDGTYFLAVTKGLYEFNREERDADDTDNKLTIKTNVPDGWSAALYNDKEGTTPVANDPVTGAPWLSMTPTSGGAENDVALLMARNGTSGSRTAYIIVTARRLRYIITVTQTLDAELTLWVSDPETEDLVTELFFLSSLGIQPEEQNFMVTWLPLLADLRVENTQIGSMPFPNYSQSGAPDTGTVTGGNNGTGTISYTVRPPAMTQEELADNPFEIKISRLDFRVNNSGDEISRQLFIYQKSYNLASSLDRFYYLNDQPETVSVRANFPWVITAVNDPDNILQNENELIGITGGDVNPVEDILTFTMAPESQFLLKTGETATITFRNTIDDRDWNIVITGAEALFLGRFGGQLLKDPGTGEWQFERWLYVQVDDAGTGAWLDTNSQRIEPDNTLLDGKQNTYNLAMRGADYQAATMCFRKNPGYQNIDGVDHDDFIWYLPANRQLVTMMVVHEALLEAFRPTAQDDAGTTKRYLSSSQSSRASSAASETYYINYSSGSIANVSKTGPNNIRCVRELKLEGN